MTEGDDEAEERTALIYERTLWSSDDGLRKVAAAILRHALGYAPTDALARAFSKRYLQDDEPLRLEYGVVKDWLAELNFVALD